MRPFSWAEVAAWRARLDGVDRLRREALDGLIREYHRLGCRTTELVHLFGDSRAEVQRALHTAREGPSALPAPPVSYPRTLTPLQQWALTAFWWDLHGADGETQRGLAPPPLGPEFLAAFCDVPPRSTGTPIRTGRAPASPPLGARTAELLDSAIFICRTRPHEPAECATGPARFALLTTGLRCGPWAAAVFLTQHVAPHRVWVRPCSRCGRNFVSPSHAHRHCGCAPGRLRPDRLRLTRVALAGAALR